MSKTVEVECNTCGGHGSHVNNETCSDCGGKGVVEIELEDE